MVIYYMLIVSYSFLSGDPRTAEATLAVGGEQVPSGNPCRETRESPGFGRGEEVKVPVFRAKESTGAKYWKHETPIQNHKLISQSPLAHVAGWNVAHHAHSPAGLRNARFEHRKGQAGVGDR